MEYFYKNIHNKKDGLYPECKRCSVIKSDQRRENNKEHYQKIAKTKYKSDKDRVLSRQAKHRETRKDYYSQKGKDFRQSEKGKQSYKIYIQKRKKKKHIIYDEEWEACKKYFNNKCAYCGLSIDKHYSPYRDEMKLFDFHREHVIEEGRNDIKNCIPSCNACNNQKKRKSLNNWYNTLNPKYSYEKYHKIYMWLRYDHKKYIMPKRRYKGQHISERLKEVENNKKANRFQYSDWSLNRY